MDDNKLKFYKRNSVEKADESVKQLDSLINLFFDLIESQDATYHVAMNALTNVVAYTIYMQNKCKSRELTAANVYNDILTFSEVIVKTIEKNLELDKENQYDEKESDDE
jgi:hypothetical protein